MKKMIGIFATLIIALGMSGVAFAHWSETLYINGTVYTGELDAEWSVHSIWDNEPSNKDVSGMTITPVDSDSDGDYDQLDVVISNAYPSIDYYAILDVHNNGSIPLHTYITIDPGNLPDGTTLEFTGINDIFGGPPVPPLENGAQIHPGRWAYARLHVHLPQSAAENTTYTFTITVEAVQWNEP
ncbi:MAG: hypothetical protein DRN83_03440 [Hadesarchaea archaeon]|nr:MAG: hypothetical protein DRN83_03440 [Hadesarchaea archaeon]